eukprot:NODE_3336_length_2051_cov_3.957900.p1 GENE.NODE_3336_length_2051_cov_3.957900~~NODE_3336_length_2051_cov_3.957900.p1  ORF type:complete len:664 (-),score=177.56 NODE_3336_length_2051_cov_3.957900:60-1832(-)
MASATNVRENEAATYAKVKATAIANIEALTASIAVISKGAGASFLQTTNAQAVRSLVAATHDMMDGDRETVLSFLSGSQAAPYAPQSGEIVGILKQLKDDIEAQYAHDTATEETAINVYNGLMAAKKKEVYALTNSIENLLDRAARLGIELVNMKHDLADTNAGLSEDRKFLRNLKKNCVEHQAEWDERVKTRNEELAALSETVKVLNDDDALELFKKALPSASSSFVQMATQNKATRARALTMLRRVQNIAGRPDLDFIALALQGNAVGFGKVLQMMDRMVANMKQEQLNDDEKKKTCRDDFDSAEDKIKGLENSLSDLEVAIESGEEALATLKKDIATLVEGLQALDDSVAEATEQRNAEHVEFTEFMASDSAAKELLNFAKNRLHQFYNARMHKAAPKRELGRDERIMVGVGGADLVAPAPPPGGIANTGITEFDQVSSDVAPPPPPETYGAYSKQTGANTGVIAMMDLLIKELDKDMQEAQTSEELAKKDFEQLLVDSKEKKAQDTKTLTEKKNAKSDTETELDGLQESRQSTQHGLKATKKHLAALHDECDWLVENFDTRKQARASEIDAIGKAKDVLNGASYEP